MRPTVVIHVDALRHDYVTEADMPFLARLRAEGVGARLVPPFGFEPDGAYLTGTHPEDYEGGTHFVRADREGRLPFTAHLPGALDALNVYLQYPIRRTLGRVIARRGETARIRAHPYVGFIPFRLLRYFDVNDKHLLHEPDFCGDIPTVFDYLRRAGRSYFFHGAPGYGVRAEQVAARVLQEASAGYAFYFLMIGDLDVAGHRFGPEAEERRACARQVDGALERIWNRLNEIHGSVDLLVFGDHGMDAVTRTVDFRPLIRSLPLKPGRDYVYFLDSTLARFWPSTDRAARILAEALAAVPGGRLIDEAEREDYRIRFRTRRFGDLIFWVDGGTMIFPNFWHVRGAKKGMHGYRREVEANHAAAVFHSAAGPSGLSVVCSMQDVFQTIMAALGLEPEPGTSGAPLQHYVLAE